MPYKLICISHDDTQNYPFCILQLVVGLDTQLGEPTNQNSIKFPKVVYPTNRKTLFYNFVDKCNKQTNVPFLPE